jgi:hypothetical protein
LVLLPHESDGRNLDDPAYDKVMGMPFTERLLQQGVSGDRRPLL